MSASENISRSRAAACGLIVLLAVSLLLLRCSPREPSPASAPVDKARLKSPPQAMPLLPASEYAGQAAEISTAATDLTACINRQKFGKYEPCIEGMTRDVDLFNKVLAHRPAPFFQLDRITKALAQGRANSADIVTLQNELWGVRDTLLKQK